MAQLDGERIAFLTANEGVEQGLVSSRNPDDLPAVSSKLVEELREGVHEAQSRSVGAGSRS